MPHTKPRKAKPSLHRRCPGCQHLLVEVVTDQGELLELDTTLPCWVFSGREVDTGHRVVVHSRGYVPHHCQKGAPYGSSHQ